MTAVEFNGKKKNNNNNNVWIMYEGIASIRPHT